MAYHIEYKLKIINGEDYNINYEDELIKVTGYYPLESDCGWRSCESDMKQFSLNHPNTLFEITGDGEESTDLWKQYFLNGKTQICRAKITFDSFDKSLMS